MDEFLKNHKKNVLLILKKFLYLYYSMYLDNK